MKWLLGQSDCSPRSEVKILQGMWFWLEHYRDLVVPDCSISPSWWWDSHLDCRFHGPSTTGKSKSRTLAFCWFQSYHLCLQHRSHRTSRLFRCRDVRTFDLSASERSSELTCYRGRTYTRLAHLRWCLTVQSRGLNRASRINLILLPSARTNRKTCWNQHQAWCTWKCQSLWRRMACLT